VDSDRRAMAHMKLPERGILRVTAIHDGHSHEKITGIITAPGIRSMQVNHKTDQRGRCTVGQELAVLVDRADTSRIAILWDEPAGSPPPFQYGPGQGGQPNTPQDIAAGVVSALDRAFRQRGRQVPPNVAARMEQALNRLGQAGAQGQAISDAINQALGHASGQQSYGPGPGQQYGQPYNPAGGQPYGPGPGQPYGPPSDQAGAPPFGQGGQGGQAATGFPQVSWTDQQVPGAGPQAAFDPAQPAQFPAGGAGELANAIVLAAQDVAPMPGIAAPGGALDVTLEVRRADGSIYTARTRLSVISPEQRAALATPGTRLTVRIDPNDPTRVEIDQHGQF
jgi:hypothetical protein